MPGRGKSVSLGSGSAVTRRLPCLHRDLRTFRAPGRSLATPSGHAPGAAGRDCGLGCAGAWLYWLRPAHWLDSVWTQARALILVLVILTLMGLKRRCSKTEVYRPVYNCQAESDLLYSQPRNISYIDLYTHKLAGAAPEVGTDVSKESHTSSGLGSSEVSFNDTVSECGEARSTKTFRETHFDTFDSKTLPAPGHPSYGDIPCVHTLPYTLFHCQHACFDQHHQQQHAQHHHHLQLPDCK